MNTLMIILTGSAFEVVPKAVGGTGFRILCISRNFRAKKVFVNHLVSRRKMTVLTPLSDARGPGSFGKNDKSS